MIRIRKNKDCYEVKGSFHGTFAELSREILKKEIKTKRRIA